MVGKTLPAAAGETATCFDTTADDANAESKLVVGIGELAVTDDGNSTLATYSLGSCLGVVLYDPVVHVGGLWHPMLPDSSIDRLKADRRPGMFIDTGWPAMLRLAGRLGAQVHRLKLYVVGGAQVMDPDGVFNIGRHNYLALRKQLREAEIPLMGEEIGGVENRTVYLYLQKGLLRIRCSGQIQEIRL